MRRRANALLLLASTVLALAAAELVLRQLAERREVVLPSGKHKAVFNPFRADARLSYALRPGWSGIHEGPDFRVAVHVNALGMRGAERPAAKPAGVQRVLVLGDSFAFGWGVAEDDALPARLERRWRATGGAVQVLDAAVPGYSAAEHWIYLREHGLALAPDAILLVLSENDAEDLAATHLELGPDRLPVRSASLRRFIAEDGRMHYLNEAGRPVPERSWALSDWLAERSLLYTYLRHNALRLWLARSERLAARDRARRAGPAPAGPIDALPPEAIERGLEGDPAFRLRYHRFLVASIRELAARRGIALAMVLTGSDRGALSDDCARDPACLDLGAALARPDHEALYLPVDGHWSARGHAAASSAAGAWLAERAFPGATR